MCLTKEQKKKCYNNNNDDDEVKKRRKVKKRQRRQKVHFIAYSTKYKRDRGNVKSFAMKLSSFFSAIMNNLLNIFDAVSCFF